MGMKRGVKGKLLELQRFAMAAWQVVRTALWDTKIDRDRSPRAGCSGRREVRK